MNLQMVCSKHQYPVLPTTEWRRASVGTILCPECGKIRNEWRPKVIDICLEDFPRDIITGSSSFAGVRVFHRDLISQILEHLGECILGRCCDASGRLIEEYVTCYPLRPVVLRANNGTRYRICSTCGAIGFQMWVGNWYTLQRYCSGARVHQTVTGHMLLDQELAFRLDLSQWPEAELESIAVRDKPVDGQVLPCD